jgi:hypothetical protein
MAIQIAGNQIKVGAVDTSQISDAAIDASKLDLSDNFTFSGFLRAGTPSNDADVATKSYVDGIVGAGVFWKEPAAAASTGNVTLSNPGVSAFDNHSVSSGARILIRAQSQDDENGVWIYNGSSSAMTRATDCDSAEELNGMAIFVTDGDTYADQAFVQTATVSTLDSDAVTYVRFSGLGQVTAGSALSKSGDTLNVQVDDSSIEVNGSDQLQLKDSGVTNAKLAGSISADKLAGGIGDSLLSTITSANKVSGSAVQLNGSGGLENLSGLKISDLGVTAAMLAGSIPDSKLSTIATADKVSGSAVQLAVGGGLADDSGLKVDTNGIETAMVGDSQITPANLCGSIPDSKLSTIATADKVSGSAVQLAASGGLSDNSGLQISASGVTAAMLAGSIPDSKLNQITSASKVAGSAVQLASGGGLANDSGLKVDTNGIETAMVGANQITSAKINFEPTRETLTTNGNDTSFTLSNSVPDNFDDVFVFRNGLFLDRVASNPSGQDEYTSSITSNSCTIVFGSAPAASDKVVVKYFQLK